MKKLTILTILAMGAFSLAAFASDGPYSDRLKQYEARYRAQFKGLPDWSVTVQSTYAAGETLTGIGTIIEKNKRYYVLVSSHVSQGELKLQLKKHDGTELKYIPGHRLANNTFDIELIELASGQNLEAFHYNPSYERFFIKMHLDSAQLQVQDLKWPLISISEQQYTILDPRNICEFPTPWDWQHKKQNSVQNIEPADLQEESFERIKSGMTRSFLWDEWLVDSGVTPGMSGGPLLTVYSLPSASAHDPTQMNATRFYILEGVLKSFNRESVRSQFSTAEQVNDLMADFERQFPSVSTPAIEKINTTDATRWRWNGRTYRDYGQGLIEISRRKNSGRGTRKGGATRGDGGVGSCNATDSDIQPGLEINGESAMAFAIHNQIVYANSSAIVWMKKTSTTWNRAVLYKGKSSAKSLFEARLKTLIPTEKSSNCQIDISELPTGYISIQTPFENLRLDLNNPLENMQFIIDLPDATLDITGVFATDLSNLSRFIKPQTAFQTPTIRIRSGERGIDNLVNCQLIGERK